MSTIDVRCPNDRMLLRVPADAVGKQIRCPGCGKPFTVADPAAPVKVAAPLRWFVARGKEKLGPFTQPQLRQMAGAKQIAATDMVLREGETRWAAASTLPDVFGATTTSPAPAPTARLAPPAPTVGKPSAPQAPVAAIVPAAAVPAAPPPAAVPVTAAAPVKKGGVPGWVLLAGGGVAALFLLLCVLPVGVLGAVWLWAKPTAVVTPNDTGGAPGTGGTPVTPPKAVYDTRFIGEKVQGAIVLHPRRALGSKLAASLPKKEMFAEATKLGIDPEKVERIVSLNEAPGPGAGAGPIKLEPVIVVTFAEKTDIEAILRKVVPEAKEATLAGKKCLELGGEGDQRALAHVADDRTLVVGPRGSLEGSLAVKSPPTALIERLNRAGADHDVVVVQNVEPLRPFMREGLDSIKDVEVPPELDGLPKLPDQLRYATVLVDLDGPVLLTLDLETPDEATAQSVEKLGTGAVTFTRKLAPELRKAVEPLLPDDLSQPVLTVLDDAPGKLSCRRDGTHVLLELKTPRGMDALVAKVGPMLPDLFVRVGQTPQQPPADVREKALAWVRDNNTFGPRHKVVTDTERQLFDQVKFGSGFQLALAGDLVKSGKATILVGWGGTLTVLELTPEQAKAAEIQPRATFLQQVPDDQGGFGPRPATLTDLRVDAADRLSPTKKVTGTVAYDIKGRRPDYPSLRLVYVAGGVRAVSYHHLTKGLQDARGQVPFSFLEVGPSGAKPNSAVVMMVELVSYPGPDRLGEPTVLSNPVVTVVTVAGQ